MGRFSLFFSIKRSPFYYYPLMLSSKGVLEARGGNSGNSVDSAAAAATFLLSLLGLPLTLDSLSGCLLTDLPSGLFSRDRSSEQFR